MGFKGMEKEVFLGCITLGIPYYIIKKIYFEEKNKYEVFFNGYENDKSWYKNIDDSKYVKNLDVMFSSIV